MSFFNPLEGSALLRCKGTYTEAPLFEYNGQIFVKRGKGFLKLLSHERTSDASVNWTNIRGVLIHEHQGHVYLSSSVTMAA